MIISFEGLDGCGKSTQLNLLYEYLLKLGKKVKVLREPGGNTISEMIRTILLDKKNLSMCDKTELLLYLASRAQLVHTEIEPLLDKNYIVILDRFIDSTTAYQGYGRGLDLNIIRLLNNFVTSSGKFIPDITFFIDLQAEQSLKRIFSRGEEINRMESLKIDFFERIRNGFIEISVNEPERVFRIDGSGSIDSIFNQVRNILIMRKIL